MLEACRARGLKVATAESCTGGLVAGALTDIAGSSDVVDRGFVTYSNEAKQQMLGVPADTIANARRGEPRRPPRPWRAARSAKRGADLVVAITGIAGPGGGSADKPVGLVHFAAASRSGALTHAEMRYGDIGRERRAAQVGAAGAGDAQGAGGKARLTCFILPAGNAG